jgi:hypothetical protein
MKENSIKQKIQNGLNSCPVGVHCYFIKLNSKIAAKCYYEKESCETAYKRQSLCYEEGLAPETFENFEIDVDYYDDDEDLDITKLYCYVTEIITPCVPLNYGKNAFVLDSECDNFQFDYEKDMWEIQEKIKKKTGWHPNDVHGYNWGWNGKKLQLLDFF